MRTSESIAKIAPALLAAQKAMTGVTKDGKNPHFGNAYATLEACWAASKDHLHSSGLTLLQFTGIIDGEPVLFTRLQHESGEFMEGTYPLKPSKPDPQGYGSAITYARRYTLCAAVGLCPEDDDGNDASRKAGSPPAQRAVPVNGNGNGGTAKANFTAVVRKWSGVSAEDLPAAMRNAFTAAGMKKQDEASFGKAAKWCADQIEAGIEFNDAVARQKVQAI